MNQTQSTAVSNNTSINIGPVVVPERNDLPTLRANLIRVVNRCLSYSWSFIVDSKFSVAYGVVVGSVLGVILAKDLGWEQMLFYTVVGAVVGGVLFCLFHRCCTPAASLLAAGADGQLPLEMAPTSNISSSNAKILTVPENMLQTAVKALKDIISALKKGESLSDETNLITKQVLGGLNGQRINTDKIESITRILNKLEKGEINFIDREIEVIPTKFNGNEITLPKDFLEEPDSNQQTFNFFRNVIFQCCGLDIKEQRACDLTEDEKKELADLLPHAKKVLDAVHKTYLFADNEDQPEYSGIISILTNNIWLGRGLGKNKEKVCSFVQELINTLDNNNLKFTLRNEWERPEKQTKNCNITLPFDFFHRKIPEEREFDPTKLLRLIEEISIQKKGIDISASK